jgi:hypothetical protein
MLPGFAKNIHHASPLAPFAQHAGLWDAPKGCVPTGTTTFCTLTVLWCVNHYICPGPNWNQSSAPYPCGACIGISDPGDW